MQAWLRWTIEAWSSRMVVHDGRQGRRGPPLAFWAVCPVSMPSNAIDSHYHLRGSSGWGDLPRGGVLAGNGWFLNFKVIIIIR